MNIEPGAPISLRTIKYRLAHDFQLAIITFLGSIVLIGITPFTVLRGINGQWGSLAIDILVQGGILGSMLRAWTTGGTHGPSLFLGYFIGLMAVIAVYILGIPGKFWFYPAIIASFFLIDRRKAMAISLFGLFAVSAGGGLAGSFAEAASFFVTVVVSALLSYVFAYRSALQRAQLETLATKDALTGTFNRRSLFDEVERVRKILAREYRTYGILMLDLDFFKHVNDHQGHAAGDRVLVDFALLLEQNIRQDDHLFRYGEEEFVVLIQQSTQKNLQTIAEHLRSVTEQHIRSPNGSLVTTSIGGALLCPEETVETWFARADAALYLAKNQGRNQVVIDPGH